MLTFHKQTGKLQEVLKTKLEKLHHAVEANWREPPRGHVRRKQSSGQEALWNLPRKRTIGRRNAGECAKSAAEGFTISGKRTAPMGTGRWRSRTNRQDKGKTMGSTDRIAFFAWSGNSGVPMDFGRIKPEKSKIYTLWISGRRERLSQEPGSAGQPSRPVLFRAATAWDGRWLSIPE